MRESQEARENACQGSLGDTRTKLKRVRQARTLGRKQGTNVPPCLASVVWGGRSTVVALATPIGRQTERVGALSLGCYKEGGTIVLGTGRILLVTPRAKVFSTCMIPRAPAQREITGSISQDPWSKVPRTQFRPLVPAIPSQHQYCVSLRHITCRVLQLQEQEQEHKQEGAVGA